MICVGLTPLAWALSYEMFPSVARSVLVLQTVSAGFGSYAASNWASANAGFAGRPDVMITGLLFLAVSNGCVFLTSRLQRMVVPWCCVAAAWAVALVVVLRTP
jgi:hypothetical protein